MTTNNKYVFKKVRMRINL